MRGQMDKSTYAMEGGRSKRTPAYDGKMGGSNFCHFGAYVLPERPY